jgi:hypothetical protein
MEDKEHCQRGRVHNAEKSNKAKRGIILPLLDVFSWPNDRIYLSPSVCTMHGCDLSLVYFLHLTATIQKHSRLQDFSAKLLLHGEP